MRSWKCVRALGAQIPQKKQVIKSSHIAAFAKYSSSRIRLESNLVFINLTGDRLSSILLPVVRSLYNLERYRHTLQLSNPMHFVVRKLSSFLAGAENYKFYKYNKSERLRPIIL